MRTQLAIGHRISRWFRERSAPVPPVQYVPHHTSHAASAFYPSPFDDAATLTVDGVGEWATSTIGVGHAHRLRVDRELRYPDSVGLLYSAFTSYCGLRVNSGEGELMGLAPYGEPRHVEQILDELVELRPDGSIVLDQRSFAFVRGGAMTSDRFHRAFGGPPLPLGTPPGQREADLAASIQVVLEEILLAMAAEARARSGSPNLCLAGGTALNCAANGRLRREAGFDGVWVQPAAGDAGGAVGAALWTWHEALGNPRPTRRGDGMSGAFLGPAFSRREVEEWAAREGLRPAVIPDDEERARAVAARLDAGAVVGWFTGRMEFGPRALGHRSILADPRVAASRDRVNAAVKERARFRPLAPAVLAERADELFETGGPSPYMTFTVPVKGTGPDPATGSDEPGGLLARLARVGGPIPAVTHVDGSARIQTVDARENPELHRLLAAFDERTGCPALLNTSFNRRDEPIVCTPADALASARHLGLDLLVIEHLLIELEP